MVLQPIYVLPLLVSMAASLFLAGVISRFRHAPGALPLLILFLSAGEWAASYALELSSPTLESKLFWARVEYIGIIAIPICWFYFSTSYLVAPTWISRLRRGRILVPIIPAITLLLILTSYFHGLIWKEYELHNIGSAQFLELEYGPWFWISWVYSYGLLVFGSIWLSIRIITSKSRLHRWQIGTALAGILIPWLGNIVYVTQLSPVRDYDWTPVLFTFSSVLLAVSLFHFHLMPAIPVGYKNLIEDLADGVMILDSRGNVIDLNPAARRIMNLSGPAGLGQPIAAIFPEKIGPFELTPSNQEYTGRLRLGEPPSPRYYSVHSSPLTDANHISVGHLIVLHDITQQKLEQDQLQKEHDDLEVRIQERTQELLKTNEQLKAELDWRAQAEKALRESESLYRALFENANDSIFLIDVEGKILQVNQKTAELLGYARDELLRMRIQDLIAPQDYSESEEKRRSLLAGHAVPIFERILHKKSGQVFPVEINLSLVADPQGQPEFIQAILRDISHHKEIEEKQRILLQEIGQSREQLRLLAARLADIQDIERRQIATELHDRIGQNLTGLNMNLQIIQKNLDKEKDPKIFHRLDDSLSIVKETIGQVRNVMANLNPPMLDEFGLISTLHWYCGKFSERTGLKVSIAAEELEPRLPQRVEMTLFRIMQELLTNVAKHAQATEVSIELQKTGENINISVQDNGVGFDPRMIQNNGDLSHWGLIAAKERAIAIGAKLIIHSTPGSGTCIFVLFRRDEYDH